MLQFARRAGAGCVGPRRVRDKQEPRCLWAGKMPQRRHPDIVAVGVANENSSWRTLKVPEILMFQM
jgi:hypothetical protein